MSTFRLPARFLLTLLLLVAASFCSTSDATLEEGQALLNVQAAWQNGNFSSWVTGQDPCARQPSSWDYVTCDLQGRVVGLNVSSQGLSGTLPDAIGDLTNLQVLSMSNNSISGPLPASLFTLTSLRSLNLSLNPLAMPFPSDVVRLVNLEEFSMSEAAITGAVPP